MCRSAACATFSPRRGSSAPPPQASSAATSAGAPKGERLRDYRLQLGQRTPDRLDGASMLRASWAGPASNRPIDRRDLRRLNTGPPSSVESGKWDPLRATPEEASWAGDVSAGVPAQGARPGRVRSAGGRRPAHLPRTPDRRRGAEDSVAADPDQDRHRQVGKIDGERDRVITSAETNIDAA